MVEKGIQVVADPLIDDVSHAIIPAINTATLKTRETDELMEAARNVPRIVHGPFMGSRPKPSK